MTTDAAGWALDADCSRVGAGGVGLDQDGAICFACQNFWSCDAASLFLDVKGKFIGSKTITLEMAGMLIPFLLFPDILAGQHVVLQVDNMGCVFGWNNGYCKDDQMALLLIRCLVLVTAKLEVALHVQHIPRMSSWEACLANRLSRVSSTSQEDKALVSSFNSPPLPEAFLRWLSNPFEEWSLPINLI